MLTPSPYPPAVTAITSSCKLRTIEVPSVEELLTKQYPHYPYNKTFAAARNEPLAILHTSGTTGLPKPIVLTHDYAASAYYHGTMEAPEGYVGYMNSLAGFVILD
jgi:acyl-coenzyme A synthetase/AMP-(fatty) acid ligase